MNGSRLVPFNTHKMFIVGFAVAVWTAGSYFTTFMLSVQTSDWTRWEGSCIVLESGQIACPGVIGDEEIPGTVRDMFGNKFEHWRPTDGVYCKLSFNDHIENNRCWPVKPV